MEALFSSASEASLLISPYQHSHKLLQQFLLYGLQWTRSESCNRVVIRCCLIPQQIHEADVFPAGSLDLSRTVDHPHVRIDQYFKQNPRRIFVSSFSGVGALDLADIHPFHYGAYQSHRIICCYEYFFIKRIIYLLMILIHNQIICRQPTLVQSRLPLFCTFCDLGAASCFETAPDIL